MERGFPTEGPSLLGLVPAVDGDGIMRARGAEIAAPGRSAVVNKGSRVHEQFPAPAKQAHREGIGVSVRAGKHAEPAAVEDQMTV